MSEDLRDKYDRLAGSYTARYADPDAVARFYVDLVSTWGPSLGAGATVLELGCADGFMTDALLGKGFVVTALDLSPRMIDAARDRLAGKKDVELEVADVATFDPAGRTWDVVLGAMWTFFAYVEEPERALEKLRAATGRKLIVDRNPRTHPLDQVESTFGGAGFRTPEIRPVIVPLSRRSTPVIRAAGRAISAVGPAWKTLVRRKLNVALLGVPDEPGTR
ncbi:MAG: class I SAM-dependent methyltransferase [Actinomycetota bacterium]